MEIESIMNNQRVVPSMETGTSENTVKVESKSDSGGQGNESKKYSENNVKQPSQNTIDSAFSDMNTKIREHRTRCEYSYNEPTKRISIKVYDDDTDELIREVPPEESLEVLQKVWELAGIIVDKKL